MADTVTPSTAQVVSAVVQNLSVVGAISLFTYWGKLDGTLAAVFIAAVAGLDLAKVAKLRAPGGMAAALGAVGASQWLGRVG